MKAAIVERFNRTLKNKMWARFSLQGSYKWLFILQSLVTEYNNTKHSTIKMKPIDVTRNNEQLLLNTVYNKQINISISRRNKFKAGDFVRISKYKSVFEKGYTPNWTTEVFEIYKVQQTNPVTYLLKDIKENEIKGGFYEYELQKAKYPDVYLMEKIIRRKGNKLFVKWLGLDNTHNSWINKNDVI
jgi:excinuclease UvrABC nuclease subunit